MDSKLLSSRLLNNSASIVLTLLLQFFAFKIYAAPNCQDLFRIKNITEIESSAQAKIIAATSSDFKEFTLSLLWLRNNGQSAVAKGFFRDRKTDFTPEERERLAAILIRIAPQLSPELKVNVTASRTSFRNDSGEIRDQPQFWVELDLKESWAISSFHLKGEYDLSRFLQPNADTIKAMSSKKLGDLLERLNSTNQALRQENSYILDPVKRLIETNKSLNKGQILTFVLDARPGQETEVALNERWIWGLERLGVPTRRIYLVEKPGNSEGQFIEVNAHSSERRLVDRSEIETPDSAPVFFMNDGTTPPVPIKPSLWKSMARKPAQPFSYEFAKNHIFWLSSKQIKFRPVEDQYEKEGLVASVIYREVNFLTAAIRMHANQALETIHLSRKLWRVNLYEIESQPPQTPEEMKNALKHIRISVGSNAYFSFCRFVLFGARDLKSMLEQMERYHRIMSPKISEEVLGHYLSSDFGLLAQLPWVKTGNYPAWMKTAILEGEEMSLLEVSTK